MGTNTIDAMPTKRLFIDMLTRDIPLIAAILDLADNSADGARRMRGASSYRGLETRIAISNDAFSISDNCGGMSVEVARKYAFRFGRAEGMPSVKHSIGEFGVGMKRAIFKLGNKFKVVSATKNDRFVVEENVAQWAHKPKWEFEFSSLKENISVPKDDWGTSITVTDLHEDVSSSFTLENFRTELINELKSRLQEPISRGLSISVNGIPIHSEPLKLLSDSKLAPARFSFKIKKVGIQIFCGLGKDSDPALAGWNVYCNGRLILDADKTGITGWVGGKGMIPVFHNQFNYFRGFVYFDSDSQGDLPWNTTKTNLNTDSPIYRATKIEMMRLMRPVVDFLNKLKEEKEGKDRDDSKLGPLEKLIESSHEGSVEKVAMREMFTMPVVKKQIHRGPVMQRIQYDMPLDKVNEVKAALKARSFTKVGEGTFNYFYETEIEG